MTNLKLLSRHCRPTAFSRSTQAAIRLFSAPPQEQIVQQQHQAEEELLHPSQFLVNGTLPVPKTLSPSSIIEFKNCPQSYLFQYIFGLKQGTSRVLAKGSMIHSALEKLFDLTKQERTLNNLQNLFRRTWGSHRGESPYKELFQDTLGNRDLEAEIQWGKEGLKLLENYMQKEDPTLIQPAQRELWVRADLPTDPFRGVTAAAVHREAQQVATPEADTDTFHVRGIVDRLDLVKDPTTQQVVVRICDYKTGKAPNLKYSPECNERIREETFFQLKIYALILREMEAASSNLHKLGARHLRLFYLTSQGADEPEGDSAVCMENDLGATQDERDKTLFAIHQDLANVWNGINDLCASQDPLLWKGCNRSFCYCHICRKRFAPGTVWEPPLMP